jgi:hypothetical protein
MKKVLAAVVRVKPKSYPMGDWDRQTGGLALLEVEGDSGWWAARLSVQRPGEARPHLVSCLGLMPDYSPRNAMLLCMGAMGAHHCDRGEARENGEFVARCGAPA